MDGFFWHSLRKDSLLHVLLHCLRKASASADFWAKRYRLCGRRSLGHSQHKLMPWSCHISYKGFLCPCSNSNMKGFLFHHRLETFMQRQTTERYWYPHHLVVNGNMAMSLAQAMYVLASSKHRLQPRQGNQCHIIVDGECWVGKFAVWRFPVMQPSDIQVWEACPLPKYAWFVPDNCCICTANGSGCVSLGGGDYDGDLLMFTSNPILLRFLDCTPSSSEMPKFNAARAHVEGLVEQPNPSEIIACMFQRRKSEGFSLQWQREPSNKLLMRRILNWMRP